MRLEERSYSSKVLRPRPMIHREPDGSFLIITTSWGAPEIASRVNDDIAKYIQASRADVEVTSPFEFLTSLTTEANYLRIAALISNEQMYRSDNKTEYSAGLEILILLQKGSQMAYAQVGAPQLLIQKSGQSITPVSMSYDSSVEFSDGGHFLSPMPQHLLGVESNLNIRSGDFKVHAGDRLVVFAGGSLPESLWSLSSETDLQRITQKIVQKNPEAPFWLGLIDL